MANQRRTYDNTGRAEQARRRQAAILDACRQLLDHTGYGDLTIRAVAEAATVSQETIYKIFGSKRRLVKTLYDQTLAGDDEPVPLAGRPEFRAVLAETDPRHKIIAYAHLARLVGDRVGLLAARLSGGGAEAAEITAETDRERLIGTTMFVSHLAAVGHLRPGLDPVHAADGCWLLISPQLYRLSTVDRGWSGDAYEAWLADMLIATLLASPVR